MTALELDPALASSLRERLGDRVEIVGGDGTAMPFEDQSFSGAACFTMLHHVPSEDAQNRLFAEVGRVLKPGGTFAGSDSTGRGIGFALLHVGDTKVVVDPDDLPRRLEAAGFGEVSVEGRAGMSCASARAGQGPLHHLGRPPVDPGTRPPVVWHRRDADGAVGSLRHTGAGRGSSRGRCEGRPTALLIALVMPATAPAAISEFPVPTPASTPFQITAGPDRALWFTEGNGNKIGRITTTGEVEEFRVPTPASCSPGESPPARTGALWVHRARGQQDRGGPPHPADSTEFTIPTPAATPGESTAGPDGALWFTETNGNKIGRITTSGRFTEFTIPTPNSNPVGITAGPDGALWFAESDGNNIGRITTAWRLP